MSTSLPYFEPLDESDTLDPVMQEAFHRNRLARVRNDNGPSVATEPPAWYARFVDRLIARLEKNHPFELMSNRDAERQAVLLGDLILRLFEKRYRFRRLAFVCKKNGRIEVTLGATMGKGGAA